MEGFVLPNNIVVYASRLARYQYPANYYFNVVVRLSRVYVEHRQRF